MMGRKVSLDKIKLSKGFFYTVFLFLIAMGKYVRYTIMKEVLVDAGIGHSWINSIIYGEGKFKIWSSASESSDTIGNSIFFYKMLNIFDFKTYEQFEIAVTIIFSFVVIMLMIKTKKYLDIYQMFFLCLSVIVLNMFAFTLSKEPIQMLYFIAMYIVVINNKLSYFWKNILVILVMLITALTFRSYYVLAAMFFVIVQVFFTVISNRKKGTAIVNMVILLVIIGIAYYVFLKFARNLSPDSYNELIRVRTRVGEAKTDMLNILPSSNLYLFIIDYLIMIIRMMFPIELVPYGIKYVPYVLYQLMITYLVIINIKNISNNSDVKNITICIYMGYLFASAAFEPDFGSWIRHESVLFPLFLILADIFDGTKKYKILLR